MAEVASDSTAGISGHACCSIWTKWWDRRSGCADACAASQMPAPFGGKRSGRLPAPPHDRFSIRFLPAMIPATNGCLIVITLRPDGCAWSDDWSIAMCGGSDTGGGRPPSADAGAAFATRSAPVADENRAARSEPPGAPKGCGRPSDVTGAAAATAAAAAAVAAAAAAAAEAAAAGTGAARGAEA